MDAMIIGYRRGPQQFPILWLWSHLFLTSLEYYLVIMSAYILLPSRIGRSEDVRLGSKLGISRSLLCKARSSRNSEAGGLKVQSR